LDNLLPSLSLCSRRETARMVEQGLVRVNSEFPASSGTRLKQGDVVHVEGRKPFKVDLKSMGAQLPLLLMANKRAGDIVTRAESSSAKGGNFFDRIEAMGVTPGLVSVGRLDVPTEGLLLLTNSGRLQRFLELPTNGLERVYEARTWSRRKVDMAALRWFKSGPRIGHEKFRPVHVQVVTTDEMNDHYESLLRLNVTEGRYREVRRLLASIGLSVTRLTRTDFGPFSIKGLGSGQVAFVAKPELILDRAVPTWREYVYGADARRAT
jgi:23S rRNA pseudouridine2605 synthase